jgi:hypothetical protein
MRTEMIRAGNNLLFATIHRLPGKRLSGKLMI